MTPPSPAVRRTARLLGFAGLLPQVAAVMLAASGRGASRDLVGAVGGLLALVYGAAILSFLGGIWWGFAMRRDAGQGALAILAVLPSLVGVGLVVAVLSDAPLGWTLVALGSAIALTLVVDHRLAGSGEAPEGWLALRVPLSLGLGGLTILAGVLAAAR